MDDFDTAMLKATAAIIVTVGLGWLVWQVVTRIPLPF